MAYIPPHKRHSGAAEKPTPIPDSLSRRFNQSLTLDSPAHRRRDRTAHNRGINGIVYAPHSISRWWIAGGDTDLAAFRLEPFSCETMERKIGFKSLVLTASGDPPPENADEEPPPWVVIAERVERDLLAAASSARSVLDSENGGVAKMSFVAKFGRILFHGEPSSCLDSLRNAAAAGADSKTKVHKTFYTAVSKEHNEELHHLDLLHLGYDFESEKQYYILRVLDKIRPRSIISCKCSVAESGGIEIRKTELDKVRHLVVDISCLSKKHDMRLMLTTKQILNSLNDDEHGSLNRLARDAVIDPDVKGGLRWPLGKETVDDRFHVVGVWHIKHKAFMSENSRLKFRHVDRFDFMASVGEVVNEVTLYVTRVSEQLQMIFAWLIRKTGHVADGELPCLANSSGSIRSGAKRWNRIKEVDRASFIAMTERKLKASQPSYSVGVLLMIVAFTG